MSIRVKAGVDLEELRKLDLRQGKSGRMLESGAYRV